MSASQSLYIKTQRTGRVSVLGSMQKDIEDIWMVFHGYRQLAERFVRRFDRLAAENRLVVAPEGLSRFYLADKFPQVGASWMTRVEREHEIDDQLRFLDQVYQQIEEATGRQARWHFFGFSQGVATLWRWLGKRTLSPASVTFCCGMVPEELEMGFEQRLREVPVCNIYALNDQFISLDKARAQADKLANIWPEIENMPVDGPHEVHGSMIQRWMTEFLQLPVK